VFLNHETFGQELFVNSGTELCIEITDGQPEMKKSRQQACVYLRHWKPEEYELGELVETIVEGTIYEALLNHV
jgi:hypothetical protein